MGQNKRFSDCLKTKVNFWIHHDESKIRGPDTLGSILKAPGYKYLKMGQKFKVIISSYPF